jgi:hypothetical protein
MLPFPPSHVQRMLCSDFRILPNRHSDTWVLPHRLSDAATQPTGQLSEGLLTDSSTPLAIPLCFHLGFHYESATNT